MQISHDHRCPLTAAQVQMQAVGDTLLVHWQPAGSQAPPETLDLWVPHYVAETPSAHSLIECSFLWEPEAFCNVCMCVHHLLTRALRPVLQ